MCLAVCCPARGGGLVGKLILLPTVEERPKKKIASTHSRLWMYLAVSCPPFGKMNDSANIL